MTGPRVRLGIVIPAHNEAKTISGVVQAALPVAKAYGGRVIVVAHNCADDTAQLAAAAGAEVIVLNEGHGKSAAVAAGVAALDVEIIGLLDADCRGITWKHVLSLALPVLEGEAMMAVGCFDYSTWNPITQAVPWSTGQRFLLAEIFPDGDDAPNGYELELALNLAVGARRGTTVCIVMIGTAHRTKLAKGGITKGIIGNLRMWAQISEKASTADPEAYEAYLNGIEIRHEEYSSKPPRVISVLAYRTMTWLAELLRRRRLT